jgi:hypothetical protein
LRSPDPQTFTADKDPFAMVHREPCFQTHPKSILWYKNFAAAGKYCCKSKLMIII